ncbi:hypothetical protein A3Q32_17730 [Alcanivorax sp. KX64203]|nr:hypothetical protein A3Q32_17730 [Alcanivorax sp. KX64203]
METKIKDIARGDLYALLSICTKEDLDPLVKCITGKFSNWLEINDDYKKYSPDHTKYYRVIADEIRLFGGNTFRNLTRGEGPPYDEVVFDVCRKLDIPCHAGETVQNERNLLTFFLERQWTRLSETEREKLIEQARLDAAKKAGFNAKNAVAQVAPLLLARYAVAPIGWGMAVFNFADTAFSVTVPCVLHVAYLRKKHMEEANFNSMRKPDVDKMPVVQTPARSSALLVGDSEESPVLSLISISEPKVPDWTPVTDDDEVSRLNPLLQAVPSLVAAGEMANGQYMEVVINGPLLQAKGQDGYRLITMIDGRPSMVPCRTPVGFPQS